MRLLPSANQMLKAVRFDSIINLIVMCFLGHKVSQSYTQSISKSLLNFEILCV
jgi:hypothetical protein